MRHVQGHRRRSFTLLELVAVVVLVAIVAAIAVVGISQVLDNGRSESARASAAQVDRSYRALLALDINANPTDLIAQVRTDISDVEITDPADFNGALKVTVTSTDVVCLRLALDPSEPLDGRLDDDACTQTAATIPAGVLSMWGVNGSGQLGNGTTERSLVPIEVAGLTNVTAVSVGSFQTCAVVGGEAWCWGQGWTGNLPVKVDTTASPMAGRTVTAISAGHDHACAIADGLAFCWGTNTFGQLGNNSAIASATPVLVSGLTNVTAISAGASHTCAVAGGQAYCWGQNFSGQLGNGSIDNQDVPNWTELGQRVAVPVAAAGTAMDGPQVTDIAAAFFHTCAVAGGQVFCWGVGFDGQLGDPNAFIETAPVQVVTHGTAMAGLEATTVSVGFDHTCAVAGGQVFCWGGNGSKQLGNNSTQMSTAPVPVGLSGATSVSVGAWYSCAVAGGQAYCWGNNYTGQVGNNSTEDMPTPQLVTLPGEVLAISAREAHTAVLVAQ